MRCVFPAWLMVVVLFAFGSLNGCVYAPYSGLLIPKTTLRVTGSTEGKFGGYAYVLLRDANEPDRNQLACVRYIATFSSEYSKRAAAPEAMVSVAWPLRKRPDVPSLGRDCSWLVENYDFDFSTSLLRTLKCATGEKYPSGPLLVASESAAESDGRAWSTDAALVVDLSNSAPNEWTRIYREFNDQLELGPQQHWGKDWFDRTLEALKLTHAKASRFLNDRECP